MVNNDIEKREEMTRKIQLTELELIRLFVGVCEKERLKYYMLGGTMLGAVRHKGYIPWDDDADFGMPRPDYEKFSYIIEKYLDEETDFLKFGKTMDYDKPFFRLVSKTKMVGRKGFRGKRYENIWIDILPLDGMPNGKIHREISKIKLITLRKLYMLANLKRNPPFYKERSTLLGLMAYYICRYIPIQIFFSMENRWNALDNALRKYDYEKSEYLITIMGAHKLKELFKKEVFGDGRRYDFEGMQLIGPQDYDFYLTQIYGDYMTPPPESKRNWHGVEDIKYIEI